MSSLLPTVPTVPTVSTVSTSLEGSGDNKPANYSKLVFVIMVVGFFIVFWLWFFGVIGPNRISSLPDFVENTPIPTTKEEAQEDF